MQTYQHFIAGSTVSASDGAMMTLPDPANGQPLATAAAGTAKDAETAVLAAHDQVKNGAWAQMDGADRGLCINRLADLVERDADLLADMDAGAIGRPSAEPRMLDLPNAIDSLRHAAGWADKIEGRTIPTPGYMGRPTLSYTERVPVGVVAAIVPWNTPLMITCWKVGALLAAGCAVVIKPAEQTPMSALHLAALCQEAGFPDGVVNVVTGYGEALGPVFCEHPKVDKISFTGSPETGAAIQRLAAPLFKHVALELGGKSPQIVFADADLEAAVAGCAMGLFFNQGQVCAAGTRLLVHADVADAFTRQLANIADGIKVGNPAEQSTQMGAIASQAQFDKINDYIRRGQEEGASVVAGGPSESRNGWYVRPTVFSGAHNEMSIARDEIFGPVGTVIIFHDEAEAIAIANDTRYGLAASVWTSDVARAHRVARRIEAGAVGINAWAPIDARLPWGGFKQSGLGRECGLSGVLAYTQEKTTTVMLS